MKEKGYLDKPVIQSGKLPGNIGGAGGFYEGMKAGREEQPDCHAVTKKQKVILSSFGLSENDVQKKVAEIGLLLEKNQSLNHAGEESYGTDEDDPIG